MKKENLPQPLLDELTQVIQSLAPVQSIYLLGANREERVSRSFLRDEAQGNTDSHYEFILLVISHKEIWNPRDFMESVHLKMKKKVKIFSIHFLYEDVLERLDYGDIFLAKAMGSANQLWQEEPIEITYPGRDYTHDELIEEWKRRMARAEYFRRKALILDEVADETARMEILSQIVLHGSAALLWLNWQFRPKHFDFEVLLKLCRMFSTSPDLILPDSSYKSQRVFEYLKEAHHNLQFRTEPFIHYEDTDLALEKVDEFLDQVYQEGEALLKALQAKKEAAKSEPKESEKEKKSSDAKKSGEPKNKAPKEKKKKSAGKSNPKK